MTVAQRLPRLLTGGALLALATLFFFPMIWMVMSSFKSNADIFRAPFALPRSVDLGRWVEAWEVGGIGRYALNSAIVTGVSVTAILLLGAGAAFAFSRYRFAGRSAFMSLMALGPAGGLPRPHPSLDQDGRGMSDRIPSAGRRYLEVVGRLLERLVTDEWPNIRAGAELVADALADGRSVHAFGTGHSHLLAEELYYRAGGLVHVHPILFEGVMLHASAPLSTSLERLPGLADALLADHPIVAGDVLIVASNSGGNVVTSELAVRVREIGGRVIAVTSLRHATSSAARPTTVRRLHELADVVIDNGGQVGDAAIDVDGFGQKVGPTSTVVGAAILDAMVAEVVELLVARGIRPEVYASSNLEGGDDVNARFVRPAVAR